jgi:hypothetical protein
VLVRNPGTAVAAAGGLGVAEPDHVTELFSLAFYDDNVELGVPGSGYSFGRIAAASFFSAASEGGAPAGLTAIRT